MRYPSTNFLSTLVIPVFVGYFTVPTRESPLEKSPIANKMPVSVLVEFPAGRGDGSGPNGSPFFSFSMALFPETNRKVNILDGDEVRIESIDCVERLSRGPKGRKGQPIFGEVGKEH